MDVGNTDNPGTTVQCFAAIIIFIGHLFSGSKLPLYQDAFLHTEGYLMACSVVLIILFVGINYLTGAYIYKYTQNTGLSMMFQIIPFLNMNIIQRAIVLEPEAMIIIVCTFFMALLFINAPESNTKDKKLLTNSTIILFALFSGFLIASKYTCIPLVVLVLFILNNNKERLIYMGAAAGAFLFFIIPAIPKFKSMYQWVWNLFTHDGIYGKGDTRIINPSQYIIKLKSIFLTDTIFTVIYSLITLAFLLAVFSRLKRKDDIPYFRTICGIWCSVTLLILIVAKHCDFHYLIPAECSFPLGLVVSYRILSNSLLKGIAFYKKHERRIIYPVATLFVLFMLIEKVRYLPIRHPQPMLTDKYIDEEEDKPLLIAVKSSTECERIELSLYLGYLFSGNMQDTYARFLSNKYPQSYIFWDGSDNVLFWGKEIPVTDFGKMNRKMLVYMKGYNDSTRDVLMNKLYGCNRDKLPPGWKMEQRLKDSKTIQEIYSIENGGTAFEL